MEDYLTRIVDDILGRFSGPLHFRLIVQPMMASIFAILDGLKDARGTARPYLWAMLSEPAGRAALIRDGWKRVGKVFLLALVLDVVYQIIVFRYLYVLEMLLIAFALAIVPYLLLRGLVTRIARLLQSR